MTFQRIIANNFIIWKYAFVNCNEWIVYVFGFISGELLWLHSRHSDAELHNFPIIQHYDHQPTIALMFCGSIWINNGKQWKPTCTVVFVAKKSKRQLFLLIPCHRQRQIWNLWFGSARNRTGDLPDMEWILYCEATALV